MLCNTFPYGRFGLKRPNLTNDGHGVFAGTNAGEAQRPRTGKEGASRGYTVVLGLCAGQVCRHSPLVLCVYRDCAGENRTQVSASGLRAKPALTARFF